MLREAEEARLAMLEESSRREAEQRAKQSEAGKESRRRQIVKKQLRPPKKPPVEAAPLAPGKRPDRPVAEARKHRTGDAARRTRRFTPVEAPKRPEREREEAKKAPSSADSRPQPMTAANLASSPSPVHSKATKARVRVRSLRLKRAREKEKRFARRQVIVPSQPKQARDVIVPETITVQPNLPTVMAEKTSDLVKALFRLGIARRQQ